MIQLALLIEAVEALNVGAFALPFDKRAEAARMFAAAAKLQSHIDKILDAQKVEVVA